MFRSQPSPSRSACWKQLTALKFSTVPNAISTGPQPAGPCSKLLSTCLVLLARPKHFCALPVITVLGPSIAAITTGGFVVELVFAIPGLGRYFVQAVQQLDYTVIMGTTVFYGAFLVFMVLVVDILYGFIDPRIRVGKVSA